MKFLIILLIFFFTNNANAVYVTYGYGIAHKINIDNENICNAVLNLAILETGTLILIPARNSLKPETIISLIRIIIAGTIVQFDIVPIDVKTKRTSVKPKLDYDCSISNWNTKQQCDYYIFCRIKNDFSVGWILGYYDKDQYLEDSIFMKRGTIDKSNGYIV